MICEGDGEGERLINENYHYFVKRVRIAAGELARSEIATAMTDVESVEGREERSVLRGEAPQRLGSARRSAD